MGGSRYTDGHDELNETSMHSMHSMHSSVFGTDEDLQAAIANSNYKDGLPKERSSANNTMMLRHFRKESEALSAARALLCFAVIIAGAVVGGAAYVITHQREQSLFESQFNAFALEILNIALRNCIQIFGEMASISTDITSQAIHDNVIWPFITIPFFNVATERVMNMTGSNFIGYSPIITSQLERLQWENHTDQVYTNTTTESNNNDISTMIFTNLYDPITSVIPYDDPGPFLPIGQVVVNANYQDDNDESDIDKTMINYDLLESSKVNRAVKWILDGDPAALSEVIDIDSFPSFVTNEQQQQENYLEEPHSFLLQPVYNDITTTDNTQITGILGMFVPLRWFVFAGMIQPGLQNIVVVLKQSCGGGASYTYEINVPDIHFLGKGDLHDEQYDKLMVKSDFSLTSHLYSSTSEEKDQSTNSNCNFIMYIYPSDELRNSYITSNAWINTGIIIGLFFGIGLIFLFYDVFAQRRQAYLMNYAMETTDMLTNFFPSNVHERLFEHGATTTDTLLNTHIPMNNSDSNVDLSSSNGNDTKNNKENGNGEEKRRLIKFMEKSQRFEEDKVSSGENSGNDEIINGMYATKPIADLFPHTTIMFADIVGFTAWSSARNPTQVFMLLETIFRAFDKITKKRDVFKVETIGDCYVAVAGLPTARDDHAVVMALFARDCMVKMGSLVQQMEMTLGPDTGELAMRVGLHSGPVTAGVLRGEKSRFQLFGDSVNTAARIETTSSPSKIHMSQETADLLISSGHSKWVAPRRDLVTAKGKGVMRTYWLTISSDGGAGSRSVDTFDDDATNAMSVDTFGGDGTVYSADGSIIENEVGGDGTNSTEGPDSGWGNTALGVKSSSRLIEWNVQTLLQLLKKVVEKREKIAYEKRKRERAQNSSANNSTSEIQLDLDLRNFDMFAEERRLAADEDDNSEESEGPLEVEIPAEVESQLRSYVTLIASMYRDHAFHNFEHASHVMLSITKLMSRVTSPKFDEMDEDDCDDKEELLHRYTYGIASDPLLQFAVAFSALIHDVDHAGVPNTQLIKEDINLAKKYRMKSVAEKHSIRLSWERLMDADYRNFRTYLCPTQNDLKRFRNFVVNTVMATDIADKELNGKRKERWRQCFDEWPSEPTKDDVQRKATIIIEHLIQASDVAHTMQHFEVYRKWNERLFEEMYGAYDGGRAEKDPAEGWYNGELGFYDFYIIPLAKKLGDCGVFGVSSDEYLNFAQENRQKWEKEGKEIVEQWLVQFNERKAEKAAAAKAQKG